MGTRKRQASCLTLRSGSPKRLHLVRPCRYHRSADGWRVLDEFLTQRWKEQGSEPLFRLTQHLSKEFSPQKADSCSKSRLLCGSEEPADPMEGKVYFGFGVQILGFYILLRNSIWNSNKSFQYSWGFLLLFVWVVFNYLSTKHLDHCVSKFTACWGPFKFLFESKRT